jgi:RHS repeat-associated protein
VSLTGPGGTAEYIYDAQDRRIASVVNGVTTHYVYDLSFRVLEERAGNGSLAARYTYGSGIDEVLTMERGGNTHFYHRDALGSITEVTDAAGVLVERYEYDVYGDPRIFDGAGNPLAASAIGNPYLFTGRHYDPESGNYYLRRRYLNPGIGRFTSHDPLGFAGGALGLYEYVGNNPLTRVDPMGEAPCEYTDFFKAEDKWVKVVKTDGSEDVGKKVDFRFDVPAGKDPTNCCLVQFRKGTVKKIDTGECPIVKHFGDKVEANFPDWTLDAASPDPVYYSLPADPATGVPASRWNYVEELPGRFSAIDIPTTPRGYKRDYEFKMCIMNCDDVPQTRAGVEALASEWSGIKRWWYGDENLGTATLMGKALKCIDWDVKVTHNADGTVTKP